MSKKSTNKSSKTLSVLSFLKQKVLDRNITAIRYTCCLALALGASTQTSLTQAYNLDDFLGSMYSNTTDAGYFETQQRGVIAGGSFVGRFPIKPINIVQFDQPRVSAGCGGVNLFGGSFSFLNSAELTQLLRTIAQNALGLLFQLGLNAISQPLSSLLTTWSNKLQAMNSTLKNSCEVARKLFQIDYSGETLSQTWEAMKGIVSTNTGADKDYFASVKKNFSEGWRKLRGLDEEQSSTDKAVLELASSGNVTWRALNASESYKGLISPIASTDSAELESKYLLMNVIGTEIFPITADANDQCTAGTGNCEPKIQKHRAVLTIDDLISPNPDRKAFFICKDGDSASTDDACTNIEYVPLTTMFKGTAAIVNKAFYGIDSNQLDLDQGLISQQLASQKGIVGKSAVAGAQLTQEEIAFHNALPIPMVRYMNAIRNDPLQMANLAERIRVYIIKDMAANLALTLASTAEATFNGSKVKAKQPEGFDEAMRKLRLEGYNNSHKDSEKMQFDSALRQYVTFVSNSQYHPSFPVSQ